MKELICISCRAARPLGLPEELCADFEDPCNDPKSSLLTAYDDIAKNFLKTEFSEELLDFHMAHLEYAKLFADDAKPVDDVSRSRLINSAACASARCGEA